MKTLRYLLISALLLGAGYLVAAEVNDLNIVAANNTARFPENMAPSAVNDGARSLESIIARWHRDISCSQSTTGGAGVLALAATQTLTAYYDGLLLCFDVNVGSTGHTTINVDSLGAVTIYKRSDQTIGENDLIVGQKVMIVFDGDSFQMLSQASSADTGGVDDIISAQGSIIQGGAGGSGEELTLGSNNDFLASDGTSLVYRATATQAQQEAGTNGNRPIVPSNQQYHDSAAKAWINFNGTRTVSAARAEYNVSAVSDNDDGDYLVTWDTDFATTDNYVCAASGSLTQGAAAADTEALQGVAINAYSVTSARIWTGSNTAQANNWEIISIVCFGRSS